MFVYYCQCRGRGRNSRLLCTIVTVLIVMVLYTYPHNINFDDYANRYRAAHKDLMRQLFVDNAITAKNFKVPGIVNRTMKDGDGNDIDFGNEKDYVDDYDNERGGVATQGPDRGGDAQVPNGHGDDPEVDDSAAHAGGVGSPVVDIGMNRLDGDVEVHGVQYEANEEELRDGNMAARGEADSIRHKPEPHDYEMDLPDADSGVVVHYESIRQEPKAHDDNLELANAGGHIDGGNSVEAPEVLIEEHEQDNLDAQDVRDQKDLHDDNLELPDAGDHIEVRNYVEAPDVLIKENDHNNLDAQDVRDENVRDPNDVHADKIELPDAGGHIEGNIETPDVLIKENDHNNLDAPDVRDENVRDPNDVHADKIELPDAGGHFEGHIEAPDVLIKENIHDNLDAPDVRDENDVHDGKLKLPDTGNNLEMRHDGKAFENLIKKNEQDNLDAPEVRDQNDVHDGKVELSDAGDHIEVHDDAEPPDILIMENEQDNLETPTARDKNVRDENDVHEGNVELAYSEGHIEGHIEDHIAVRDGVAASDVQAKIVQENLEVHDGNLELPDTGDHIEVRYGVEGPGVLIKKNEEDYIDSPVVTIQNVRDPNDINSGKLELPDAGGHIEGRDGVEPPGVLIKENRQDHIAAPDARDQNVKDQNDLHDDNLELPNAEDNIKVRNYVGAPGVLIKENDHNNLDAPDVRDENDVHGDKAELPDADDHIVVITKNEVEAPVALMKDNKPNNLDAPDVRDQNDVDDHKLPLPDDVQRTHDIHPADIKQDQRQLDTQFPDPSKQETFIAKKTDGEPLEQCISERTNFAYIKMTKSASATMVSMLRRFGYNRDLNFVQPVGKRMYVGWPYQIEDGYYRANKKAGEDFNILSEQAVYNKNTLKKLMPANTVYFTTLREPYAHIKSVFSYYNLSKAVQLDTVGDPFTEYIRNMEYYEKIYTAPETASFRSCIPDNFSMTCNVMSYNLGYPTGAMGATPDRTADDAFIDEWLRDLDASFSLVMIVDYFDESLILLKRLMCWTWKDIMHISSNVMQYSWKGNLDPENMRMYKERSRVDYKLYDYFNQTFWKRVTSERDDFWGEVTLFKKVATEMHEYCQNASNHMIFTLPDNQWNKAFSFNKQDCYDMLHYSEILQKIKARYDESPVDVQQPVMRTNVC